MFFVLQNNPNLSVLLPLCPVKNKSTYNKKKYEKLDNNREFSFVLKSNEQNDSYESKPTVERERVLFEGPPSKSELIIPFISILTVIGIIPFITTLLRQFWVRYKITNRRITIQSGFQGNDRVEIVYRDIKKVSYITRLGGVTADIVILLKDNARLEIRSLPEWEKNFQFIKDNCPKDVSWN